jgi:hypothetical protein
VALTPIETHDNATSPAIDRGSPNDAFNREPPSMATASMSGPTATRPQASKSQPIIIITSVPGGLDTSSVPIYRGDPSGAGDPMRTGTFMRMSDPGVAPRSSAASKSTAPRHRCSAAWTIPCRLRRHPRLRQTLRGMPGIPASLSNPRLIDWDRWFTLSDVATGPNPADWKARFADGASRTPGGRRPPP